MVAGPVVPASIAGRGVPQTFAVVTNHPELLVLVVVVVVEVDKVGDGAASLRRVDVDEDGLFCRV